MREHRLSGSVVQQLCDFSGLFLSERGARFFYVPSWDWRGRAALRASGPLGGAREGSRPMWTRVPRHQGHLDWPGQAPAGSPGSGSSLACGEDHWLTPWGRSHCSRPPGCRESNGALFHSTDIS